MILILNVGDISMEIVHGDRYMGYFIINEDTESQIGSIKLIFSYLLIATFKLEWHVINVENIKAPHYQQP